MNERHAHHECELCGRFDTACCFEREKLSGVLAKLREAMANDLSEVTLRIAGGKGTWPNRDYITDERWAALLERRSVFDAVLRRIDGPQRIAPDGGCWVRCPRCERVGPHFIEGGETIGYCAQCALGERVRADLIICPEPPDVPQPAHNGGSHAK